MTVKRTLPTSSATAPVSGADYMDDVSDTVKSLWEKAWLVPTSVTNSGNDYTVEVSPALAADVIEGMGFYIKPSASATGPVRLRVTSSNPWYDVETADGTALGSGDFDAGTVYPVAFFAGKFVRFPAMAGGGSSGSVDRQVFTASGTWNKPASGTIAIVEMWGGGGGGADASEDSGGGGAEYARAIFALADLGASETVTVGAGGTTPGNDGGDSSFGSWLDAFGGGGGTASASSGESGGGRRGLSESGFQGGSGDDGPGGDAIYGGAGGGGDGGAGGTSVIGGDGGDAGSNGSAPGGGGGSQADGARGEVRVTVI